MDLTAETLLQNKNPIINHVEPFRIYPCFAFLSGWDLRFARACLAVCLAALWGAGVLWAFFLRQAQLACRHSSPYDRYSVISFNDEARVQLRGKGMQGRDLYSLRKVTCCVT